MSWTLLIEEYSLGLVSRYSTVRSGAVTWREWGLWHEPPVEQSVKWMVIWNARVFCPCDITVMSQTCDNNHDKNRLNCIKSVTAMKMRNLICCRLSSFHYSDVMLSAMASQITSLTIVYSTVNSGANQRKHQSSASLAFVKGIHQWLVNSPHKWPVTRKMFLVDDDIVHSNCNSICNRYSVTLHLNRYMYQRSSSVAHCFIS